MTGNIFIRNVRPFGAEQADLYICDGRFAQASGQKPALEIDGNGQIALPGLVEAHTHLDKTLIGMDWFHNGVGAGRNDRILADRQAKRELDIDARRQSARQIMQTLAFGVTHIRSHVDVDTEIGLANIEGVAATREAFKGLVDVQIVAFPQSGMLPRHGTLALMEDALRAGADVVGVSILQRSSVIRCAIWMRFSDSLIDMTGQSISICTNQEIWALSVLS